MANKKLSELNESFASDPKDFVLLINKDDRTAKRISVANLIKIDSSTVLDKYQFARDNVSDFGPSSIQFSAGDMDNDYIYYAPTTINISGQDASEITGQYEFAGIKNNNLYWKNSENIEINRVDGESFWNFQNGQNTLYKFSGQECYPKFGKINLSDGAELVTSKVMSSRQLKTKESPIILSNLVGVIDTLFKAQSSLTLNNKEYANISYSGVKNLYSYSNINEGPVFTPKTVELNDLSNTGTHSPLSFFGGGDQTSPIIFEYSLGEFKVNKVTEKISGLKGNCSFHQNFSTSIVVDAAATVTGIVVSGPLDISGFKPANPSFKLDIGGNGAVTYNNDIILLKRYFSGVSGTGLIDGLNVFSGNRSSYQEIESYIQSGIDLNAFDINENGYVDQSDIDLISYYTLSGVIDPSNSVEKNAMTDAQLKDNLLKLF